MEEIKTAEEIEGTELQVGYCEVCGQAKQFQTTGGVEQSQLDEWATDECTCTAASERRLIKKRQERAVENIEKLFGEKFPETAEVLKTALPFIIKDQIESITIKTGYDIDAKISVTAKGKVKVEKKIKNNISLSE